MSAMKTDRDAFRGRTLRPLILLGVLSGGMALTTAVQAQEAAGGDAERGQAVFRQCMACHRVGENARNLVGPVLNGVIGRQAGMIEGYSYSAINKAAGEAGLQWTPENIFAYLPDPNGFLRQYLTEQGQADAARGTTKMAFRLTGEQQRRDVIAYLQRFSDGGGG